MARNLFVLSALSFVLVGCFGPDKAPSPVTDGGPVFSNGPLVVDTLTPIAPAPATTSPSTKAPTKKAPGTRLPIERAGTK